MITQAEIRAFGEYDDMALRRHWLYGCDSAVEGIINEQNNQNLANNKTDKKADGKADNDNEREKGEAEL